MFIELNIPVTLRQGMKLRDFNKTNR